MANLFVFQEVFKNPRLLTDLCVVQENRVARIDFALLKVIHVRLYAVNCS